MTVQGGAEEELSQGGASGSEDRGGVWGFEGWDGAVGFMSQGVADDWKVDRAAKWNNLRSRGAEGRQWRQGQGTEWFWQWRREMEAGQDHLW